MLNGRTFHKRAPIAIKKVKAFARRMMKTKDNRIDASLNTFIWSQGVKGTPVRVRVLLQRKVAENPEGNSSTNVCTPSSPTSRSPPTRA